MRERDGERERGAHIEPLGTLMYAIAPFSTRNDRRVPTPETNQSELRRLRMYNTNNAPLGSKME